MLPMTYMCFFLLRNYMYVLYFLIHEIKHYIKMIVYGMVLVKYFLLLCYLDITIYAIQSPPLVKSERNWRHDNF